MKTLIKSIMIMLILASCSNGENNPSTETPEDIPTEINQFISKIQQQNPASFEKGSQLIYKNDRLEYVYLDDCSGELFYFEYNSDGKISKHYKGTISFSGNYFDPDSFDLTSFKASRTPLNYIYQDGKLIGMQYDNSFMDYQFIYNSDGTLHTAEWFLKNVGLWEKVTLSYSGDMISNLNKKEYNTNGTLNDNYDYTFEYDDRHNPFYDLFQDFNLLGIYTCTGFDYISSEDMGLKPFKNNVTKVFRNGTELYSATYQYDENNYPIRISYNNLNGNNSSVDIITYDK